MKSTEELKMKRGKLTEAEVKSLNSIKAGIEIIEKDPNVSIMGLREIQNIYSTIIGAFPNSMLETLKNPSNSEVTLSRRSKNGTSCSCFSCSSNS